MIKLKNILTEAIELPSKDIKMLAKMTDYNNHNEARIYLARKLGNKNLVKSYDAIMVLHNQMNQMNDLIKVREKLDKMLFKQAKRYYSNFKDINSAF
jgi:hypothetical protein|tara:strand:+ start:228 stop:518 length:291 start_codon:yes stop_codon:yes gene_type:complete